MATRGTESAITMAARAAVFPRVKKTATPSAATAAQIKKAQ